MVLNNTGLYRFLTRTFVSSRIDDVKDAMSVATITLLEKYIGRTEILNVDAFRTTVAARALSREHTRKRRFEYPDSNEYLGWSTYHKLNSPLVVHEATESTIDVHEILHRAPEQYSEVMRLCYFEGLSLKEAADKIGISHIAMRKRHERAIKWARSAFGE